MQKFTYDQGEVVHIERPRPDRIRAIWLRGTKILEIYEFAEADYAYYARKFRILKSKTVNVLPRFDV